MSAFYTFLPSLYNCLLKSISLIMLLGEVRTFLGGRCWKFQERCKVIPEEVRTSPQIVRLYDNRVLLVKYMHGWSTCIAFPCQEKNCQILAVLTS